MWDRVFEAISQDRDLEEVMLDSTAPRLRSGTAVRAHPHAAGAKKTMRLATRSDSP